MTNATGTTSSTYDNADRLTAVTKPGPSTTNYTWDNNGDLTVRGSDSFAWDIEDRMTSATVGGATTTFAYRGGRQGLGVAQVQELGGRPPAAGLGERPMVGPNSPSRPTARS